MATIESNKIIYSMIGVTKSFDRKVILKDIYLSYFYGAKIGVLGLNGSGKSTLLKILAGVETNYDGKCALQPGYTIGYLEQEPLVDDARVVREVVKEGMKDSIALVARFNAISDKLGEPMDGDQMNKLLEQQGALQEKIDHLNAWDLDHQLEMAMDALRCPPDDQPVRTLSGGERRRVALCRLLLQKPDVLILDEPTNHLDAESIAWLEQHLQRYEGTVIAVTHDRYFLDNVAGWILELDRAECIPWKGNYTSWLEQKKTRLEIEEKHTSVRQKTLQHELDWVRQNPRARQAKSKSRMQRYEAMLAEDQRSKEMEIEIFIPPGPRLGQKVVETKNLTKAFNGRILLDNANFTIPPNAVVGIIGPNGAGKTTLFRMITGAEKPDSGELIVGESVQLAHLDQSRDSLLDDETVWQSISGGQEKLKLGPVETSSRAYVSRFGFSGTDQQKVLTKLSGGERNRVHLARILKSGANVIMLDEPTNDLDLNTIRALEEAIENFAGCVLVISHDRWFLDRIATHILAFEGESEARFFEGNYHAYEEDRKKRLGISADQPHRIKYRRLTK